MQDALLYLSSTSCCPSTITIPQKIVEMEVVNHHLVFAINRERFELQNVDPSTTLLEFLRSQTRFKSVKLGCGEGGCGACVVLLSKYEPARDLVESYTVSSCLTLLCSLNGCSIITSEGLGNSKDGFHTIHQRFAGFHATQCGYCTPGMCMSLFSALIKDDSKTYQSEPGFGFSKLSALEAERSVLGNMCRCTGYRSVVDACKSFARDMDIEDLGLNSFWNKGDSKEVKVDRLPLYNPDNQNDLFPQFLKNELKSSSVLHSKRGSWYSPTSMKELWGLLDLNGSDNPSVKLVVGNTGMGYYKEVEKYDMYIDLRYINELSLIEVDETGIRIGSAVSISKAIESLNVKKYSTLFNHETVLLFRKVANHLEKVASDFIRNSGSIGGNLVMSQKNHFPSDLTTVLLAVGSTVDIMMSSKQETVTLEEFLGRPALDSRTLLVSVKIPSWKPDSKSCFSTLVSETYRASPRPLGNALPYLNAAFCAEISLNNNCSGILINKIRLAFGAFGCKHAIRTTKVEEYLIGKTLQYDVLLEATKLVQMNVIVEDDVLHASYKTSMASGFLFEFLNPLIEAYAEICSTGSNGCTKVSSRIISEVSRMYEKFKANIQDPMLLPAKQTIREVGEFSPIREPVTKTGAALQASGEAVYVDDIPSPPDCLYGAFIYSTKPLARIKGVKLNTESFSGEAHAVISFKDIPVGGKNLADNTDEPLFADNLTICAGQPIALVVANTQKQADLAANLATVEYDFDNLDPPILTVEEAVQRSSFFEVPPFLHLKPVGNFSKGMDEADHKIVSAEISLPSQYYFYMETQTALVLPDEDNCILVYSSTQCPEHSHKVIAACLGIPENNVRVITRRVGGGFGGKGYRSRPIATACALAAYTLQRPVRIYLNRKTDMIMAGGRHPMQITYTVGFKSDGKVTALHLDILINAGISADWSTFMPILMVGPLKKYNWGALSFDFKVCKTNHTSKSAMRAPGEVQGSFISEAIVEHVASVLSINVDDVRRKNLHSSESLHLFYAESGSEAKEYTLPLIWDKLALSTSYNHRLNTVKEFNDSHFWKKRGISRIPVIMGAGVRETPGKVSILADGSVVVQVGGIEMGQGLWTKVKQMTAFSLGLIQCNAAEDIMRKIRVLQSDTLNLIQGGMTGGSTTSQSSCEAVRICCGVLVERLTPLKEELEKQMSSVDWMTLIAQAHMRSMNLSVSSYYVPDLSSKQYLNYGAAVSEVEVNLLTGETMILRSDILYDCGQSVNPAVDLGQIEGAFVQGIGFFMMEEYLSNSDGLVVTDSTWSYKIPSIDTIPRQLNVEILNSGQQHQESVLSSKASGEPPLLLAASVHCATRAAIKEARLQINSWTGNDRENNSFFQLSVPATMPVVKELCGLDIVERYLNFKVDRFYER